MSDVAWLFVAFMAVWLGIGAYLTTISARQARLEARLRDLSQAPGENGGPTRH